MEEPNYFNPMIALHSDVQRVLNHTLNRLPARLLNKIKKANIKLINDDFPNPLYSPKANLVTHEVIVQETFASFLWVCCYTMVGLYDLYYQQAVNDVAVATFGRYPEYQKINFTLGWAKSLKNAFSPWPEEAANPTQDAPYINFANNLFEASILYIFFHEMGHIVLHAGQPRLLEANGKPYRERNEEERLLIYNAEVEADQFAFDCLLKSSSLEDVRFLKYVGALVAQLSNFFQLDVPDTRGFSHPDMDTRLRAVIRQVKLKDEHLRIHFKAHCSIGLQLFMSLTGAEFIPEREDESNFAQFEDLEAYLFRRIEEIKMKAKAFYGDH